MVSELWINTPPRPADINLRVQPLNHNLKHYGVNVLFQFLHPDSNYYACWDLFLDTRNGLNTSMVCNWTLNTSMVCNWTLNTSMVCNWTLNTSMVCNWTLHTSLWPITLMRFPLHRPLQVLEYAVRGYQSSPYWFDL